MHWEALLTAVSRQSKRNTRFYAAVGMGLSETVHKGMLRNATMYKRYAAFCF